MLASWSCRARHWCINLMLVANHATASVSTCMCIGSSEIVFHQKIQDWQRQATRFLNNAKSAKDDRKRDRKTRIWLNAVWWPPWQINVPRVRDRLYQESFPRRPYRPGTRKSIPEDELMTCKIKRTSWLWAYRCGPHQSNCGGLQVWPLSEIDIDITRGRK